MNSDAVFDAALKETLGIEGPRSNNASDPGGDTVYGIAKNRHPEMWKNGPPTYEAARDFYRQMWDSLRLDEVANESAVIAKKLFDIAVNCGGHEAAAWLQIALNAFNHNGHDYPDVAVDGAVGAHTLAALEEYMHARHSIGADVLHAAISAQQGSYYLNLAQHASKFEDFEFGWFAKRVLL